MAEEMEPQYIEEIIEMVTGQPPVVETPEERDARLKREDYVRRNAQAVKDREDILRRNGVIGPSESLTVDMEAALRQRCCF